ncbi:MAG: hypothetical protein IJP20_06015 [Clostridia bacterium]|nr:hypothetical protein [Clostridia bacterium]
MKKHLSTILLSLALLVCLAVLGAVIYFMIPKDCTHHSCFKFEHAPTCDEKGYTLYQCKSCTYSFEADFIAPLGHKYSNETVAPTCEAEGYTLHTCSVCNEEYKDSFIAPTGHDEIESVIAPECNAQGYTLHECADCDYYYITDYVKPTGHNKKTTVIAPTCDEEGYTLYSCTECSYSYKGAYTKATGHTYTKTYVRPNIDRTGYTLYTCTKCDSEHIGDYVFYSDIFTGAEGNGEGELAWGLDLSKWSYEVDFNALKRAGVDFVILRVGFDDTKDTKFEEYYAGAKAAGLDVGAYFFTLAENAEQAKADAKRVANWLSGKKFEYPIFYDIEDYEDYKPSTFSEEQLMSVAHTFMTEMVELGYYPGLYTGNKLLNNVFHTEKTLRLYDVWFAQWPLESPDDATILEYSKEYSMWQYMGDVYGFSDGAVEGACDINYAFKDYPEHIKKHGFNGY